MSDMLRTTISIPESMDKEILKIKQEDRFARSSYSEVARYLIRLGLKARASMEERESI